MKQSGRGSALVFAASSLVLLVGTAQWTWVGHPVLPLSELLLLAVAILVPGAVLKHRTTGLLLEAVCWLAIATGTCGVSPEAAHLAYSDLSVVDAPYMLVSSWLSVTLLILVLRLTRASGAPLPPNEARDGGGDGVGPR